MHSNQELELVLICHLTYVGWRLFIRLLQRRQEGDCVGGKDCRDYD
jgi:hypothetical protein